MKQCLLQHFQEVYRDIQKASFGLRGGNGILSSINRAMKTTKEFITINQNLKTSFSDWRTLIQKLGDTPNLVQILVRDLSN